MCVLQLIQNLNIFNRNNNNNSNSNNNNSNKKDNKKDINNNNNNRDNNNNEGGEVANLCRVLAKDHLFPGDTLILKPDYATSNGTFIVEPRVISKTYISNAWPQPHVTTVDDGKLHIVNDTEDIISVYKNDHICQIFGTKTVNCNKDISSSTPKVDLVQPPRPFSKDVVIDPDGLLTPEERNLFIEEHLKYDELFEPVIGYYNDCAGKVRARVNLGRTAPPTRKLTTGSPLRQEKYRSPSRKV